MPLWWDVVYRVRILLLVTYGASEMLSNSLRRTQLEQEGLKWKKQGHRDETSTSENCPCVTGNPQVRDWWPGQVGLGKIL